MESIKIETPAEPRLGELRVRLVEPQQVLVAIDGAGRDLLARQIEDDSLAAAHILAGDVALVFDAEQDDWLPRLYDPAAMDAQARDEWGRVPRVDGAVYATLVGLVRVPAAVVGVAPAPVVAGEGGQL